MCCELAVHVALLKAKHSYLNRQPSYCFLCLLLVCQKFVNVVCLPFCSPCCTSLKLKQSGFDNIWHTCTYNKNILVWPFTFGYISF